LKYSTGLSTDSTYKIKVQSRLVSVAKLGCASQMQRTLQKISQGRKAFKVFPSISKWHWRMNRNGIIPFHFPWFMPY